MRYLIITVAEALEPDDDRARALQEGLAKMLPDVKVAIICGATSAAYFEVDDPTAPAANTRQP